MTTIWFQLTTDNGESYTTPDKVSLPSANSDVADLRKEVKKEWGEAPPLKEVAAGSLLVYANVEALKADKDEPEPKHSIEVDKSLALILLEEAEGNSAKNPLLIVVPDRVQSTTSEEISGLTTALQSFASAQLVEECIQSQDQTLLPYPPDKIEKLYVRQCYKDVYELLLTSIGGDEESFAISGTPGIGKSLFFLYILYRLMDDLRPQTLPSNPETLLFKPKRVVYQQRSSYICFDLQQQRVTSITQAQAGALVFEQHTFYVIDGKSAPLLSKCVTLFISSPREDSFKEFVKQKKAKKWYLPVWTLAELHTCRQHCYTGLLPETLQERHRICGGVARFVFHADYVNTVETEIKGALADVDAVRGVKYVGETTRIFPQSHVLMHILVGNEEDGNAYQFTDLDVASKYIGEQLWIRHSAQMLTNLRDMFGGSPNEISRHLFEIYGHRVFSVGGRTLKCRCLESGTVSQIALNAFHGIRTPFGSNSIPTAENLPGKYYEPADEDNFPAIDSLSSQGMFQFTVAAEHPIRGVQILQTLCNLYDEPKLYFVVPRHRFAAFKKQPFKAKQGNQVVNEIHELKQYVLELPV